MKLWSMVGRMRFGWCYTSRGCVYSTDRSEMENAEYERMGLEQHAGGCS